MRTEDLPLYAYKVFRDEPSGEYVAECLEVPSLSGIGETEEEAIAALKDAIMGWLEVLEEDGISFPPPLFEAEGDFISGSAKRTFSTGAAEEGPSLQEHYPDIHIEQNPPKDIPEPRTALGAS